MCNTEHLVSYAYDELAPVERENFEAHLGSCADCRGELAGLRQTRHHLARWSPPEPVFNLSVVRSTAAAASPPSSAWRAAVPRWGLAAAAALLVCAGAAAIANLEVRYEHDGSLVLRTGWPAGPVAGANNPTASDSRGLMPAAAGGPASEGMRAEVAALHRRLDALDEAFKQVQTAEHTRVAAAMPSAISPSDLRKVLAESEARQRTEMAAYIAQIWKDFNAARVNDWTRMQQTVMQAQGVTNRQLLQQRETIDSLRYMHTVLNQK